MNGQDWKLRSPSGPRLLPTGRIYEGEQFEEALSRLLFIIEQQRRTGVLFGPAGSGKTLLLEQLRDILRRSSIETAFVDVHGRDAAEVLWQLSGELGLNPRFKDAPYVLWRRVQDHFVTTWRTLPPTVLILDHADQGGEESELLISRLIHLARQGRGLTLISAVTGRQIPELSPCFREATDIRVELNYLSRDQAEEFLNTVFQPGHDYVPAFSNAAINRLYEASEGSPKLLSNLGDLALLSSIASDDEFVTEDAVLTAAADLQLTTYNPKRTPVGLSEGRLFYD